MKEFNLPTVEFVSFEEKDVIVTSGCQTSYAGGYDKCDSGRAPDFGNN